MGISKQLMTFFKINTVFIRFLTSQPFAFHIGHAITSSHKIFLRPRGRKAGWVASPELRSHPPSSLDTRRFPLRLLDTPLPPKVFPHPLKLRSSPDPLRSRCPEPSSSLAILELPWAPKNTLPSTGDLPSSDFPWPLIFKATCGTVRNTALIVVAPLYHGLPQAATGLPRSRPPQSPHTRRRG